MSSPDTPAEARPTCERCPLRMADPSAPPFLLLGMDRQTVSAILTHSVAACVGLGVGVILMLLLG